MSVKRVYACYDDMKYEDFLKKFIGRIGIEGYFRGKEREKRSKNSGQLSVAQFFGVQDGRSMSSGMNTTNLDKHPDHILGPNVLFEDVGASFCNNRVHLNLQCQDETQ